MGDRVRAVPPHVRGIGREALGHLLQLGGQLLPSWRLALPPLAALEAGRVHRHPAPKLN